MLDKRPPTVTLKKGQVLKIFFQLFYPSITCLSSIARSAFHQGEIYDPGLGLAQQSLELRFLALLKRIREIDRNSVTIFYIWPRHIGNHVLSIVDRVSNLLTRILQFPVILLVPTLVFVQTSG